MKAPGSVFGASLLVAGCCIGAGMLGVPIVTAIAGFQPSLWMFFFAWIYMVVTGFVLLEVNLWFDEEVSLVSMAGRTLGKKGEALVWVLFLFLFYSLLVAYISGGGALVADYYNEVTGQGISDWMGALSLGILFGVFVYMGTVAVDYFNRWLMAGLGISYVLLVVAGLPHVNTTFLLHRNWGAAAAVIPVMIVSFGYHNLIPSLKTYLGGDVAKLRRTILIGSSIPLLIYLLWELVILGLVPVDMVEAARDQGDMATRALRQAVGSSWVASLTESFAFFAVVTSFLTVSLSFVDFLSDGLGIEKRPRGKIFLCLLVLAPPFICSVLYPKIFLIALSYGGGISAILLFGMLPVWMVWSGRYHSQIQGNILIPGGKTGLLFIALLSLIVICLQFL